MESRSRSDKRTRIIDAAVEVFARKGFGSARVSDIAREAGVADGTIYLYFRNKEDLLLTIFEEKMDLVLSGLREALSGLDDPRAQVVAYARYHFDLLRRWPALAQVFQVELRQSNRFFHGYRPVKLWSYLGVFEEILRCGQARGLFREDVDPFLAKWAFFGALDELSMQWVLARRRERFDLDRAAEQISAIFLRGIARSGVPAEMPNDDQGRQQ